MMLDFEIGLTTVLLPLALLLAAASLRILREYERGVVFQLGRFWKVKGPGLVVVIPGIQQMDAYHIVFSRSNTKGGIKSPVHEIG